ncbi:MAG: hypothetical protein AB7I13_00165 [Vicinamibacterales bacterium]
MATNEQDQAQPNEGRAALARVLGGFGPGATVTDQVWADFKAAVAEAQAQLREEDSAGQRRWQDARHRGVGTG